MTDVRQRTTFGNRFRLLLRLLGFTAVLTAVAGGIWLSTETNWPSLRGSWAEAWEAASDFVSDTVNGERGTNAQVAGILCFGSLAVIILWIGVEKLSWLFFASGRKTFAGTANGIQIAVAVALFVVANMVGFSHYEKIDLTRNKQFTLSPDLVDQLKQLRTDAPTTVVVLQVHRASVIFPDTADAYESVAERVTVEKVKDMVDLLREFGPQFNVVVLDSQSVDFEREVRELGRLRPGLAEAIRDTRENSILFYADGKVRREPTAVAEQMTRTFPKPAVASDPNDSQLSLVYAANISRMSFSEFLQLDKTASREATPTERAGYATLLGGPAFTAGVTGKGNLVLIPQGNEQFVRRILALEERRPRIGMPVIHPYLTTREASDELSSGGLRRALESRGFDVQDIIIKRWRSTGPPLPAAYTFEESELERVENRFNLFSMLANDREAAIQILSEARDDAESTLREARNAATPEERGQKLAAVARNLQRFVRGRIQNEAQLQTVLQSLSLSIEAFELELADYTRMVEEYGPRYRDLLRDERSTENRRLTDLKAKFRQYVNECDALIVPRLTTLDVAKGEVISPALFTMSDDQVAVIREFIAAGKPVLFALGPSNLATAPGAQNTDALYEILPRLGIELGRQTILTNSDSQAMAERQSEALGALSDIPPVSFDLPADVDSAPSSDVANNPIAEAFRITARAVDRELHLKRSGYRPVYVAPGFDSPGMLPFAAEIMFTGRDSWNEQRPLPEGDYLPKFEPVKPGDPTRGTRDEERRGPFPVGVAVEVPVPIDWMPEASLPKVDGTLPITDQVELSAVLPVFDGGISAAMMGVVGTEVDRPIVRVAAYGHGGLFTGNQLDPAAETLLVHTVNWMLNRDDRLPEDVPDEQKWRFPRTDLSSRAFTIWACATVIGLPLLCFYFGSIVYMLRRMR